MLSLGMTEPCIRTSVGRRVTRRRWESLERNSARIYLGTSPRSALRGGFESRDHAMRYSRQWSWPLLGGQCAWGARSFRSPCSPPSSEITVRIGDSNAESVHADPPGSEPKCTEVPSTLPSGRWILTLPQLLLYYDCPARGSSAAPLEVVSGSGTRRIARPLIMAKNTGTRMGT